MPVYEFLCGDCRKKFTVLCPISQRDDKHNCVKCGSENGKRLVSRVKVLRSDEELMEKLADPSSLAGLDESDPKTFASWAKNMAREMGENMDDEIDAMAEEELSGNASGGADFEAPDYSGDDQL